MKVRNHHGQRWLRIHQVRSVLGYLVLHPSPGAVCWGRGSPLAPPFPPGAPSMQGYSCQFLTSKEDVAGLWHASVPMTPVEQLLSLSASPGLGLRMGRADKSILSSMTPLHVLLGATPGAHTHFLGHLQAGQGPRPSILPDRPFSRLSAVQSTG